MAELLPAPSQQAVWVPESLQDRVEVGLRLKEAAFAAYREGDHAELRRCQLKESQYLISCTIHDLEHPSPGAPLPRQWLEPSASQQLLRGLQADLARVNQQLQQEHLAPASPAAEGHEH